MTLLCSTEWKAKVGSISISRGACRNGAKRQSYFATFSLFANSGSPQQLLHPIPPPSQHEEKKQPTSQHEKATQPAHEKERKIPPHGFICHVSYLLHSTLYVMYHPPWEGRNIWTLFTHFFDDFESASANFSDPWNTSFPQTHLKVKDTSFKTSVNTGEVK